MRRAWERFRGWPIWAQLAIGVFVVLVVAGALAPQEDEDQPVSAGQAATTQATDTQTPASPAPTSAPPTPAPTVATTTTAPPQPVEVATFTGSSDKTTENFGVRSPWRIKWTITGGAGVGIAIHDQSGARIEYLSTDPGSDESVVRRSCTCYLVISPFGSTYNITVNGIPA